MQKINETTWRNWKTPKDTQGYFCKVFWGQSYALHINQKGHVNIILSWYLYTPCHAVLSVICCWYKTYQTSCHVFGGLVCQYLTFHPLYQNYNQWTWISHLAHPCSNTILAVSMNERILIAIEIAHGLILGLPARAVKNIQTYNNQVQYWLDLLNYSIC